MNNFKQFLNQVEEKILFPFGRRTWQVLSVGAILVLVLVTLWFIFNSRPGLPIGVKVDKWEVVENELDTTIYIKKKNSNCSSEIVKTSLDSLKKTLPLLEWDSLGRFETRFINSRSRTNGYNYENFYWSDNKVKKQVFVLNENAVPNLLNKIYKKLYIDSSDFCGKLQIISSIQLLVSLYEPAFIQTDSRFKDLCSLFESNRKLDESAISNTLRVIKLVDNEFQLISNRETLRRFYEIMIYVLSNNIDEEKLLLANEVIVAHRNLGIENEYIPDDYLMALKMIQTSGIESPRQLKRAIQDYCYEIKFYHDIGFIKSLRRYLKLYEAKLEWKENQRQIVQANKAKNREIAITTAGFSLLIICVLTIILLLFSIQNLLKKRME